MAQEPYDYSTRKGVRPISWEDFHGICKALARAVSTYQPEIVLAIGRGGFYPGTLITHLLQVELYPVRVSRRINDVVTYQTPQWIVEPPATIKGRRVLIVDEICDVGETLTMVKEKAELLGAAAVKSAVLYAHTWSVAVPDYIGLISDELLLNPWDREIFKEGVFQFHPESIEALAQQGIEPDPALLINATVIELAKK
jgi:hypoxanthine phosphoribosyltransferase